MYGTAHRAPKTARAGLSVDDEPSIARITGHAEWAGADWPGQFLRELHGRREPQAATAL